MNEDFIIINKNNTIKKNNKFDTMGLKLFIISFVLTFLTSLAFCFVLLPTNNKYSLISSNTSSKINDDISTNNKITIEQTEDTKSEESEEEILNNQEETTSTKKNKKNILTRNLKKLVPFSKK